MGRRGANLLCFLHVHFHLPLQQLGGGRGLLLALQRLGRALDPGQHQVGLDEGNVDVSAVPRVVPRDEGSQVALAPERQQPEPPNQVGRRFVALQERKEER